MKYLFILFAVLSFKLSASESICYGATSNGRIENSQQLPFRGPNFESYSFIAHSVGRTYVHSIVKSIILNSYKALEVKYPDKVFKYAETGFKEGGTFKPHKTHKNGLSVDFMTPVIDSLSKSVYLPTHPLNKFGYDIEFDKNGKYQDLTIDYLALAAHIVALHKEAKSQGHDLWRVIFDPELQSNLFSTKYGSYLRKNILFSKKRSWVRHDEHYHVDFSIPCKK